MEKFRRNIWEGSARMPLSVCIITKDEEQNIARCLECLAPYGFELIVADTGSSDRTKEIALRYTDKVYEFPWRDDFAAAKNFAVSKASGDAVMVVDADEFLEPVGEEALRKLHRMTEERPEAVGRIYRRNIFRRDGEYRENDEWINRIFSKKRFFYEGRIHEQITAREGGDYETYRTGLSFVHTGYDLPWEQRKEKAARNIRLLEQELDCLGYEADEQPAGDGGQAPYLLYQLGKSYYMAKDYEQACLWFSRGLSYDLEPKLEYVIDMVETYGYALINSGQAQTALLFESIYDEFGSSADFQFLMGLIYMNNERFADAVAEFLKAAGHTECRGRGVNTYLAYYNIGVIYECLDKWEEAEEFYRKCRDYAPAQARLNKNGSRRSPVT